MASESQKGFGISSPVNASLQCVLLKKVFQLEVKCFFLLALKQVPSCAKQLSPLPCLSSSHSSADRAAPETGSSGL